MAKQNNNYSNFFSRRTKMTANILAPAKISAYLSTESRMLHNDGALDELTKTAKAEAPDEDSDDCLEFEGPSGSADTGGPSFKEFLAKKKISFSDRFGK